MLGLLNRGQEDFLSSGSDEIDLLFEVKRARGADIPKPASEVEIGMSLVALGSFTHRSVLHYGRR